MCRAALYRLVAKDCAGSGACTGGFTYMLVDMLAHPHIGGFLTAGSVIHAQTWLHDPGDALKAGLSAGLEIRVCP